MKKTHKNKEIIIPNTPWRFFFYISTVHKKWAIFAALAVVFAAAGTVATSYFFKLIIDAVEAGSLEQAMFVGFLYPVAIFLIQLTYRLSGYLGMSWTVGASKTATDILMAYLLKHSHSYYTDRFAGSIATKVKNVTSAFEHIIPDLLWAHLNAAVSFLITFILIFQVEPSSAIIFLCLVVVLIGVNQYFAPGKALVAKESAEAGTILQGRSIDTLSNMATVRQYVQEVAELDKVTELSENRFKKATKNWFYTEKLLLLNSVILFVFASGMFFMLVTRWGQGGISTGEFVLVIALISNITGTLLFIGRAVNALARTVGELREGLDDILLPYEIVDSAEAVPLIVTEGRVEWEKVTFNFGEMGVFDDFSVVIPALQRVGVVGTSGAGKSTFVSLLLRQHEIQEGSISIDGQNIAEITQDSLRQAIALVPQEPSLFHRTIRENIAYAKPEATIDEVVEAAKNAQAHDFIERLPLGYNTMVGERGVKLSGGQKQRIAIARAMLKNSPILVLDEATSALDSESEKEIQRALHVLMTGKTVIAIAHRLSTLREMDRIIVLENGKIIEDGTHEELLKLEGQYASLWTHQAGGFIVE
jgi:ATP-binding cassette, subfamily B, bacterial